MGSQRVVARIPQVAKNTSSIVQFWLGNKLFIFHTGNGRVSLIAIQTTLPFLFVVLYKHARNNPQNNFANTAIDFH
jgi:hypothetical protein